MNQPKKQPLITGTVAAAPKAPYTAARDAKDRSVNGTAADGSTQALDRRLTEGLNLLHGRLDVLHEDVRENRRDIKQLRQELWDGLKEAAADRARLAEKTELDRLRDEMHQSFDRLEGSGRQLRTEMNARFAPLEESNQQIIAIVSRIQERSEAAAWTRRRVLAAVAAGISLLAIGALLQPLLERAAAALLGG